MKIASLFILTALLSLSKAFAQNNLIDRVGLDVSFNAVGDEAVLSGTIYLEHDQFKWGNGTFYYGLGAFYGAFPNTSRNINQFTEGRTSLFQPLQFHLGHQFVLLQEKVMVKTALIGAPSLFNQKIVFDDPRYDLESTFNYSELVFTAHTKAEIAFRVGSRTNIGLFTHLPLINEPIAPLGIGIAVSKMF